MWDYYFTEETLPTGEKVTMPFDSQEELDAYLYNKKHK